MMGQEGQEQEQLFYTGFNLERRVRKDHPLRKIRGLLDLNFSYDEVRDRYGNNGNVSIPPPVILKLMLLLVFYNVRSERELMDTLPERLDWLWFLGYDIDNDIPDHSVLSKARKRWGVEVFQRLFERVVWQCVSAGLVDGNKIFMDASLVEANASNNSVVDREGVKIHLKKIEERLEEKDINKKSETGGMNHSRYSKTDPDSSLVRYNNSPAKLYYKVHRVVDSENEVITASETTTGSVHEGHKLMDMMDQHHVNTGKGAETVVADSKYGTKENYLGCKDRGINAHMPDLKGTHDRGNRRPGIFPMEIFKYDEETDTYICPSGNRLKRRSHHKKRGSSDYGTAKGVCNNCEFRDQCTNAKAGRTIHREVRQEELEMMRSQASSNESKRDIRTRKHLMERTFALAVRYGYKRARWRGLWRVQIQEYLISTIQNINILIRKGSRLKKAGEARIKPALRDLFTLKPQQLLFDLLSKIQNIIFSKYCLY
jgi:transposase